MSLEEEQEWNTLDDPDESGRAAFQMARDLMNEQRDRLIERAADMLALYDPETLSSAESGLPSAVTTPFYEREVPAFNVVQAGADTLISQLIRNKVRPLFLTDGGDAELQGKAEGMTRTVEAGFWEHGVWGDLGRRWARDSATYGTGWLKCTPDYESSRVLIERAFDWEIYTTHQDGKRGKPRQIHHVYPVDRQELAARYPKHEEAILAADVADARSVGSTFDRGRVTDQILVYESWHLPSARVDLDDDNVWNLKKCKHDGRHSISIGSAQDGQAADGEILLHEPWPFDYFPLIEFKLIGKNMGMRGRGVPETLFGVQLALNRTCKRLDRILDLHGRPIVMVQRNAKINKNLITNEIGLVIETNHAGGLQYITPNSVSPEFVHQVDRLVRWGFEQIGLSQLSATSQKPAGLESGVAIRTVLDTESMRHSDPFLGWEEAHARLARTYVDCVRLLAENDNGNFKAFWGDEKELQEINWKDVDLPESKYRLRTWPTNLFSQSPGAKKDEVLEFFRYGLFDKEEALEHLDFPDTQAARDAVLAAKRNIQRILQTMVRTKKPHVPHPYLNLSLAKRMGMTLLNQLEGDGRVDSEEADLVRQWLELVDFEIKKLMPPPPPGPPAPPGMPPGPVEQMTPAAPMGVAA